MIELERHIEILLLSNDCVIVPGLGGFMAHRVGARYDEGESLFLPPLRTLGFNPQLTMNDSLLVQSYIEAYDISYPEALRRIEAEVEELRQHMEAGGQYELNDIGTLRLNGEGHMEFEPCEAGILTPELYGLSSFEMPTSAISVALSTEREVTANKEVTDNSETPTEIDEKPIVIKMSWLRNLIAAAAAIIAFLMIGTPISNSNYSADVQQSSFIPLPATQHDDTASNATEPHPAEEEDAVATQNQQDDATEEAPCIANPTTYCIVLASQVSRKNAETFVNQLRTQGFEDTHIMETTMLRVVYGTFASEQEAYNELRSARSKSRHFGDAWVLKINN